MCIRAAHPGVRLCLVPAGDDFVDVLLGDRVEADDTAFEGVVELEVLLLRTIHVHDADRVVVRLQMLASLVLLVRVLVHAVDKRQVDCLSSPRLMAVSNFASVGQNHKSFVMFDDFKLQKFG